MKKIILTLSITSFLFACDPVEDLPTPEGDTFDPTTYVEEFQYDHESETENIFDRTCAILTSENQLILKSLTDSKNYDVKIYVRDFSDMKEDSTIYLKETNCCNLTTHAEMDLRTPNQAHYETGGNFLGTIIFTKIDRENNVVEGEFSFDASNDPITPLYDTEVTNGHFKMIYHDEVEAGYTLVCDHMIP